MNFFIKTSTDTFQRFDLGLQAHLMLLNDSALNELDFSFDGKTVNGILRKDEGLEFLDINAPSVFIRSTLAGNPCIFRIHSFGNPQVIYGKEDSELGGKNIPLPKRFREVRTGHM